MSYKSYKKNLEIRNEINDQINKLVVLRMNIEAQIDSYEFTNNINRVET